MKKEIKNPMVQQIVQMWIKEHGYDGIVNSDYNCACSIIPGETCAHFHCEGRAGSKHKNGKLHLEQEAVIK